MGPTKKIIVIEGSKSPGGWLRTVAEDGFLFEKGARSFRPNNQGLEAVKLIEALGLQDSVHLPTVASKTP